MKRYNIHPSGPIEVNACTFVSHGICYITDPGGGTELLVKDAAAYPDMEKVILLTHAHVDHIAVLPETAKQLGVTKVFLHPDDRTLYQSPANAIEPYISHPDGLPDTQWPPEFPGLEVRHTPGHTQGGVVYYFPEEKLAFAGDTIFLESIGRTDLPGGDEEQLCDSIRREIFTLPEDVILIPGHGPLTSAGHEKAHNPYVQPVKE